MAIVSIQVITISVDVAQNVLWSRIQKRLRKEPWREKYNEVWSESIYRMFRNSQLFVFPLQGEMSWMIKSKAFYDGFRWDCVSRIFARSSMADLFCGDRYIFHRVVQIWWQVISNNLDSTDLTKAAFKAICDLSKSGKVCDPLST